VKFSTEDLCIMILGGSKCHENHSNESHALLYNVSEILPFIFYIFLAILEEVSTEGIAAMGVNEITFSYVP